MFVVVLFLACTTACEDQYDSDNYYSSNIGRRGYDDVINDTLDSVLSYDEYPAFDSLENVSGLTYINCMPCVCNTSGYCSFNDANYFINSDSLFDDLFKNCSEYYLCDSLPNVNADSNSLLGMQISGGPWIDDGKYKLVLSDDSVYQFILKIKFDSTEAYPEILTVQTYWLSIPKINYNDSIQYMIKYYGERNN